MTCSNREYQCASGGVCVPQSSVCNGVSDCADGSDEVGCGKQMSVFLDSVLFRNLDLHHIKIDPG